MPVGLGKDFLVILNDNQMSISKNVGAISAYLNRTFTGEFIRGCGRKPDNSGRDSSYRTRHPEARASGRRTGQGADSPRSTVRRTRLPLWRTYRWPQLRTPDSDARKRIENGGPVLLHVITKKGLGYEPAIKNPGLVSCLSAVCARDGSAREEGGSSFVYPDCHGVRWLSLARRISGS